MTVSGPYKFEYDLNVYLGYINVNVYLGYIT